MKLAQCWVIMGLLVLALFFPTHRAYGQAAPPAGKPVHYAAPFGVLTWVNADYNEGVGQWKQSAPGFDSTLTPSTAGQVDDQGNSYFALLDIQADTERSAQYFAYSNGATLTLRLKPGSAGASPFVELADAVLRDVANIESGDLALVTSEDGGGAGYGYIVWHASYENMFMYSTSSPAITGTVDGDKLCFGVIERDLAYGVTDGQYVYLDTGGRLVVGEVAWGKEFILIGTDLSDGPIAIINNTLPSGMENSYIARDGTVLTWSENSDGWLGYWEDYYQGYASTSCWMRWSGDESGSIMLMGQGDVDLTVSKQADGSLVVHGPGYGVLSDGAVLMPVSSGFTPASPIQTFEYEGQAFHIVDHSPMGSGHVFTTYQSADGTYAGQLFWDSGTQAIEGFNIELPTGDLVSYAPDGNGGYVMSQGNNSTNSLTKINNTIFVPTGNVSTPAPPPEAVVFAGDLDIRGNLLSLGSWGNDPDQAGLNLLYQDGTTQSSPAAAIWTASRPHTQWIWERVNPNTGNTLSMMRLGADNVLTLYKSDGDVGITINPNTGRIRIAPQGDLSMGIFTSEPSQ